MTVTRAGVGVATITPSLPVHLAGYGDRHGVATSVHDDLEVRVLLLDDVGSACCLLTFDLLGMTRDVSDPIRDAVGDVLGIDRDAVLPSCTHVHAGPSTLTGSDAIGWPVPPGYATTLVTRAVEAAEAARASLAPVSLAFARGPLPDGVAVNRRGHALAASVAVLDLAPVAVVANFGIHPTVTGPSNLAVATDWVGPFRRALEAHTGRRTLFLQGCQGDVNPAVTAWDDGDPRAWAPVVDAYASTLADAVAATCTETTGFAGGPRVVADRLVRVRVGDTLLAQLAGGRSERVVELVEWAIGDVAVVAVPGEGFHAVERALRDARGERLLVAGLGPDWQGYLPRPYHDGYEEGLSLGKGAVKDIVRALIR